MTTRKTTVFYGVLIAIASIAVGMVIASQWGLPQASSAQTINVPAGRFRTIVVRPIIRTDGMFGEGGRAEVYFSDDQYRIPVLIRSRVPVVGSLSMHLRTFRPGT